MTNPWTRLTNRQRTAVVDIACLLMLTWLMWRVFA